MTPADLAAYIGAAAWLPQIGAWGYRLWSRPVIRISPAATLGVSYNGAGPAITVTAALSTKRKDALVEKMEAQVKDDKGATLELTWTFANDIQHHISVPTGETLNIGKNQPATALSIPTTALVEKNIWFQPDPNGISAPTKVMIELMDQYDYLKKTHPQDALQQFRQSKEFLRAEEVFRAGMIWHEGTYQLTVRAKELATSAWHEQKLAFTLSRQDADALKSNAELFEGFVQASLAQNEGYQARFPVFKWRFVGVTRKD